MILTRPPDPDMPPDWDPHHYPDPPAERAAKMVYGGSKVADASAAVGVSLWGLSMAQVNEILQGLALCLTIVATGITIGIHIARWVSAWRAKRK